MTERNREAFQSDEEWFLNYINHGGPPPHVTVENHLGARRAVEVALTGHESFQERQLSSLRRVIGLAQREIKAKTLEGKRSQVLGLLSNYPDWSLRMQAVGEGLESVVGTRPTSGVLMALLGEAATLSMMRARTKTKPR